MLNDQTRTKLRQIAPDLLQAIDSIPEELLEGMSWEQRVQTLTDTAYGTYTDTKVKQLITRAHLRYPSADWRRIDQIEQRDLDRQLLADLATCNWVYTGRNIIFEGPTGSGKTYLACALAKEACRNHYRAISYRLPDLRRKWETLSQDSTKEARLLRTLTTPDLLVLDEWLTNKPSQEFRSFLLDLADNREDKSNIFATQIPANDWHLVLGTNATAEAAQGRFAANTTIIKTGNFDARQQFTS